MTKPLQRILPKQTEVYVAVCFFLFLTAILTCDKTTAFLMMGRLT